MAELAFVLTLVNPAAALETGSWAAQDESGPEAAVSDVAADFADGADGPAAPGAGGMLVKGGSVAARNGVMQGAARGMQIAGRFLGGTDDVVRFIDDIGRAATNAWRSVGDDMMRLQADDAATFLPSKLAPKGGVGSGEKVASGGWPGRSLPVDRHGRMIPDVDVPHTQLGTRISRTNGDSYMQARTWDYDGRGSLGPTRDIDFTNHGRPWDHTSPHMHDWKLVSGSWQRGPPRSFP